MSLRRKLLLALVPLLAALLLSGVAGGVVLAKLGRSAERILKENYRSVLAAERMKEALEQVQGAALAAASGRGEPGGAETVAQRRLFAEELEIARGNITEAGETEAVERLGQRWGRYQRELDRLAGSSGDEPLELYFQALVPASREVKDAIDHLLALNQDAMVRKSDESLALSHRLRRSLLLVVGAGCLVGLALSTSITTRILRPLAVLSQAARRLGEGDLLARAVVQGRDELGALAAEFNTMATRLQSYRESSLGELLEAQRASQAAIDSLPDPVLVLSPEGQLLHMNEVAGSLLGLELGVANPLAALDPAVRVLVDRVRLHVLAGKGPSLPRGLDEAVPLATREGLRHLLARSLPVYSDSGSIAATTVVLQDVTRLRRFEELKDDLVATVAHEFRTPLTSLRMAVHLCLEGVAGPVSEKQAELLHAAREDCVRLQDIVDELLDLSRIQAGRIELRRRPVAVEELIASALAPLDRSARESEVRLETEIEPDLTPLLADPERVQSALGNLVHNAIRHSPAGAAVVVRARSAGSDIRFEVADQGPGIAPEHQEAVFEKHCQVPGGQPGASGLGLFIARGVALAHGGRIGVESELGHGATFWMTLPRSD